MFYNLLDWFTIFQDVLESFKTNSREVVQISNNNNQEQSLDQNKNASGTDSHRTLNHHLTTKTSDTSTPTFLLSTNLESLSPVTISLTDLSVGGSPVSPSFPSNKVIYLDSPIRITIMGSKQVGKSALAVRYLSRQDSSSQSLGSHAVSPSIRGKTNIQTFQYRITPNVSFPNVKTFSDLTF